MYFLASGTIARSHPEMADAVRALDGYLYANEGHPCRLGHAAAILRLERGLVNRLLDLYRGEGVVSRQVAYICPGCDGFLARVPGEGDLWCDVCERTVRFRSDELEGEKVWRPLPEAPRTGWQPAAESAIAALVPKPPIEKVIIQIIAGDRGGSPRSVLQTTREEQAIRDAVGLGEHRHVFDFAPSVHAASVDRLIECQWHSPDILHFTGHGEQCRMLLIRGRDLLVETTRLDADQVETIFKSFDPPVRLAVFNACHSLDLARHLTARSVVEMAIGVGGEIPDDHAVEFARTLYRQLSDGRSVQGAFQLGGVHTAQLDPPSRPQLVAAPGVDPSSVVFATAG